MSAKPEAQEHFSVWGCRACGRIGHSSRDLLAQGCEGTHEEFVPKGDLLDSVNSALGNVTDKYTVHWDEAAECVFVRVALREQPSPDAALIEALRLIRDGRCSCGYRFKWTGMQMRCENCDTHVGVVPPYIREIAEDALAAARAGTSR